MKKTHILMIIIILTLPLGMYYFLKSPSEGGYPAAIAEKSMPKVIKFTSAMCYDCQRIEKELKPLTSEYKNRIVFYEVDAGRITSQNMELIKRYNVTVVPTLIYIDKEGNMVKKTEGYMPQAQLRENFEAILN